MADTRRLNAKPQDLTDAYGPPSNFLEIDIFNPQTVGMGRARYTSYELRMRVRPSRGPGRAAGGPAGRERGLGRGLRPYEGPSPHSRALGAGARRIETLWAAVVPALPSVTAWFDCRAPFRRIGCLFISP